MTASFAPLSVEYSRFRRRLILSCLSIAGLVIGTIFSAVYSSYVERENAARIQTQTFVHAIAAHVEDSIQLVDFALIGFANAIKLLPSEKKNSVATIRQLLASHDPAANGVVPAGQPLAGAMLTVGMSVETGAGKAGCGPKPALSGIVAISPQPAMLSMSKPANSSGTFPPFLAVSLERSAVAAAVREGFKIQTTNFASSVILAFSNFETGQPILALFANASKVF